MELYRLAHVLMAAANTMDHNGYGAYSARPQKAQHYKIKYGTWDVICEIACGRSEQEVLTFLFKKERLQPLF